MKNFLLKTFLFGLIFFAVEKFLYVFVYVSPGLEIDKRLEKIINGDVNKDLIVLGSSRGARDVIASQIEDTLKISSYNLSYPGSDISFHEFLLRSLVKFNQPPKMVLLIVDDPTELSPDPRLKFRLDRLYPLAKYDYINDELIQRGEKNILSRFMVLARMNKKNLDIRKKHFTALDTIMRCGSMPVVFQKPGVVLKLSDSISNYDRSLELPEKVEAFKKIQQLCIDNNIQLYIVFPPNFKAHDSGFEKRLRDLSASTASFYVYDTTNAVYQQEHFYYDYDHLRKNGAIIFTNELIHRLQQDLKADH